VPYDLPNSVVVSDGPQRMTFTVTQAAHVLGIGRTLAYELARRYRETGGADGLPVILIGSCLKVPCWALFEFARTGRVVSLTAPVAVGAACPV
jgi:hypothetical protein